MTAWDYTSHKDAGPAAWHQVAGQMDGGYKGRAHHVLESATQPKIQGYLADLGPRFPPKVSVPHCQVDAIYSHKLGGRG